MAILKKRTSSKQLPEARGLDRAPLGSVIRNFDDEPSISGGRPNLGTPSSGSSVVRPPSGGISSGTSGGAGAITSTPSTTKPAVTSGTTTKPTTTPSITTKPPLTSTTKPTTTKPAVTTKPTTTKPTITTKPTTTTKPTVTTKTSTTPTTKTTSPTSVVKPVVKPKTTNTNSTTNKVVNALTGAVLGAGTKMIIDRITGKPKVVEDTGSAAAKAAAAAKAKADAAAKAKQPAGSTTPAKPNTTPAKPSVTPKSPTSIVKPPLSDGSATDLYKGTPADPSLGLPSGAIDNGDGTYTTVFDDGSSMTFSMENDAVLYSTDTDGKIDVFKDSTDTAVAGGGGDDSEATTGGGTRGLGGTSTAGSGDDTTLAENVDDTVVDDDTTGGDGTPEYYQDDEGNYYTMNADGGYDLEYYADGSAYVDESNDTAVADNTETEYFEDSLGNVYAQNEDGTYELYANADGSEVEDDTYYDDSLYADDTEYTDDADYLYAGDSDYESYDYGDSSYYEDYDYAKRGGLITMMKKGGVPRFEDGGYSDTGEEVQDWQNVSYNYGEDDDPSLTGSDSLYSQSGPTSADYLKRSTPTVLASANEDNSFVSAGDDFSPAAGIQYFDDGSYIQTFDDGSTITVDSDGNVFDTTEAYQTTRDDEGNYIVTDSYGNMTVYDPNGNLIPLGGGRETATPITNVGSGRREPVTSRPPRNPDAPPVPTGIGSELLDTITGALGTTAGAAGAGALIASLLGSDFTGGGSGAQNQGLDMSQVGIINPRTTDFGIGPTNFVGYDEYGTDANNYTPNEELLRNLNAPGYNPVNEGDYGYEEVPAEESADEALPAMASGGLSSMSTPVASYYTFGQPADILANLGMRPQPPMNPPDMMPQIGQQQQQQPMQQGQQRGMPQQGMPPQMAQQAPVPQQGMMPQGMPQQMRMGGLPHVSNVPMTQGRMDFRRGSAVHGQGDGQSDDIPAMLADGEYVIDAETVAQIGNGSTKAGAQALDKFREGIRAHKRSAPINKIPPKTKALTSYLKGAR